MHIAHETDPSLRHPDHPDGVKPSHHPSLQCPHCEDVFTVSHLVITYLALALWPSLTDIVDGSNVLRPTMRAKGIKMVEKFTPPPGTISSSA